MTNSGLQAELYRPAGPCLRKHRQPDARPQGQRMGAWEHAVKIGSNAARAIAHARCALLLQSTANLGPQRNERLDGRANRNNVRMQTALYNGSAAINLGVIRS
jgi:hypothetical protein